MGRGACGGAGGRREPHRIARPASRACTQARAWAEGGPTNPLYPGGEEARGVEVGRRGRFSPLLPGRVELAFWCLSSPGPTPNFRRWPRCTGRAT